MSNVIGYARASKSTRTPSPARRPTNAGATRVLSTYATGARADRPDLAACLHYLRAGDTLVVAARPARQIATHLIDVVDQFRNRDDEFGTEEFDTSTSRGRRVFHALAAVAEFERQLVRERTIACWP